MEDKNVESTSCESSGKSREVKKVRVVRRIVKKFKRDMNLDNPNSNEPTKKDDPLVRKRKKKTNGSSSGVIIDNTSKDQQTLVKPKNVTSQNNQGGVDDHGKGSIVLPVAEDGKEKQNIVESLPAKKKRRKRKKKKSGNTQNSATADINQTSAKNTGARGNNVPNANNQKKQNNEYLQDPMRIVEVVMARSKCKDLDLSTKAALRLQQDDAIGFIKHIDYNKERINMISTDSVTVLPHAFSEFKVNLSPYAITRMEHIYDVADGWYKRVKQDRARRRERLKQAKQMSSKKDEIDNSSINKVDKNVLDKSHQELKSKKIKQQQQHTSQNNNTLNAKTMGNRSQVQNSRRLPEQTQLNDPYVLRWLT